MGNIALAVAAGAFVGSYIEELRQMPLNIQQKITKRFTCWISGGHQEDANEYLNGKKVVNLVKAIFSVLCLFFCHVKEPWNFRRRSGK